MVRLYSTSQKGIRNVKEYKPIFKCKPCGVWDNRATHWGSRFNMSFMRPRIVGGKTLTKTTRPWLVYVEIKAKDNSFHCGGSIVNKR